MKSRLGLQTMRVNADDFGISKEVNYAVATSFEKGYISSATLMANGLEFDDAIRICKSAGLSGKVGLHLNLTEGLPLTREIRKSRRFCSAEGQFAFTRRSPSFVFSATESQLLYDEILAQGRKLIKEGCLITHIDGHQHVHTEFAVFNVLRHAIRELGVTKCRIARNVGDKLSLKWVYRRSLNSYIAALGLANSEYFGSVDDCLMPRGGLSLRGRIEVMVHPSIRGSLVVDRKFTGSDGDDPELSAVINRLECVYGAGNVFGGN